MKRNSGLIGALRYTSINNAPGVYDTFDQYNATKGNAWPKVKKHLTISPSSPVAYNEGQSFTVSVTTEGYENGETLYWTIETVSGVINSSDFSSGLTAGSFSLTNNTGSFSITLLLDGSSETNDVFYVAIRTGSISGPIVLSSGNITINNPTFSITPNTSSFNEGSSVTFNVATTNITNGTLLYYSLSGSVIASDFTSNSLVGSVPINNNAGSFSLTGVSDATTEGNESFSASLRIGSSSGTIVATSSSVTLNDTSQSPAATITASANPINEGQTFTATVNTTNFPSGTLYWTLEMTTGTLAGTDFSATSGSFTVSSSTGSFSFNVLSDGYTEGTETITLKVRLNSISGTVIGTLTNVNISDTSTGGTEPQSKSLSFYESRFGATIGTLNVYVVDSNGNTQGSSIYTATGNLGTAAWFLREVTFPVPSGSYRIAFHYVSGTSFTGDIALDLITIDGNQYSFEGPSAQGWVTTSGINTSSSSSAFTTTTTPTATSTATLGRWNLWSGSTTSSSTGPTGAYSGTYYIYAETSSPNYSNTNMWLFSPLLTP